MVQSGLKMVQSRIEPGSTWLKTGYKYDCSIRAFEFCLKRINALSLIWRTRSRVRLNFSPISSNECGAMLLKPKNRVSTSRSRSANIPIERLISWDKESVIRLLSVSASVLCITSSRVFSSPVTNGASKDRWRPELESESEIFSTDVSRSSANSSGVGTRSNCCSSLDDDLRILLKVPTWFNGKRTIRL